ncbi:fatty acid hydroxylase domain-containing protein 2-like [Amphiura filiformis]|uniref:fatty acid hydroxylase domain-containing protein 2-like n=1 Tax=Amphiura filiformis TaxID=82378 RepID=UPI003B21B1E8
MEFADINGTSLGSAVDKVADHLKDVWTASGTFWNRNWGVIHDGCHGDDFILGTLGFLVPFVMFWIVSLLFMSVDAFGFPAWVLKHKVQPNEKVTIPRILHAARVAFTNQMSSIPFLLIWHQLELLRPLDYGRTLPTMQRALVDLVACVLIEEIGFYYTHRLLHHPLLYKHIHKKHHEWTAPISLIALYSHPFENILSNLFPVIVGPLIMGSHIAVAALWYGIGISTTCIVHSGYHLPLLPPPEMHDFHHLKFINNFGVLGILDYLHGTNKLFVQSKYYQRFRVTFSLTPVLTMYPDDELLEEIKKSK